MYFKSYQVGFYTFSYHHMHRSITFYISINTVIQHSLITQQSVVVVENWSDM